MAYAARCLLSLDVLHNFAVVCIFYACNTSAQVVAFSLVLEQHMAKGLVQQQRKQQQKEKAMAARHHVVRLWGHPPPFGLPSPAAIWHCWQCELANMGRCELQFSGLNVVHKMTSRS